MRTLPAVHALLCLAAFTPVPARAEQAVTVQGTSCQVWDQYPDRRKAIRWSGACRNGWANGPGVLSWSYNGRADGQVEGTLVDGRLEGRARVAWRDGRRLDASFEGGLANGQGTFVWPDGREYRGEWRDDRRTGSGTLTYPDGSRYVGTFTRNRPSGTGTFVAADGRRFQPLVDARGTVYAGRPLESPPQSAAVPPPPEPQPPEPEPERTPQAQRLEDWLNESPPVPRTDRY